MSLQGGGIAALYLVTFFAFKVYLLVPAGLAFGLFVGLAISTVLLSVLQESEPLLVIGSLGGFLAPILASTGEGSHVALFSYYLLLNLSIAAVAWRQAWRIPALVAFVCTYGIASVWGALRYEAQLFRSTEPFVLLFLALFTGIAILHAWRRPPELRGLVDGTLVFGTPFLSILLQAALVRDMELGLALSAAGFGVFYASIAIVLFRNGPREIRPLSEAFVALAVGFATMAIPFAFDEALTTSVAWALEGAGLYWVGARQSRRFPRFAGVVLQGMAAAAFYVSVEFDRIDASDFLPVANGRALSCFALAFAGVLIARIAWVRSEGQRSFETNLCQALGIWGLLWWSGGVLAEIDQFVAHGHTPAAVLFMIVFTMLALEILATRFDWEPGRRLALAGLPAAAITFLVALDELPHLLAKGGWLVWPLFFGSLFFLWERQDDRDTRTIGAFRSGALWLLALVGAFALYGLLGVGIGLSNDWKFAGFGVGLASVLLLCLGMSRRSQSPFDRHLEHARVVGLGPIALGCLMAIAILQLLATGDASPIPHLPLLNPTDLTVAWLAIASISWWRQSKQDLEASIGGDVARPAGFAMAVLAFIALNGLLARAVHQWAGVAFDADALWDSVAMQVTLSIAWTVVGLVGMVVSSRLSKRSLWMGCAVLLGVVVLKLFSVDLSQLSTIARIATFLVVGVLLLVLGYISPVPPGDSRAAETGPPAEPSPASASTSTPASIGESS